MKIGKTALFVTLIIVLILSFGILNNNFPNAITADKGNNSIVYPEEKMMEAEVEEFSNFLYQKDGFFEHISSKLQDKGFQFQTLVSVYSKEEIWVEYIMENKVVAHKEIENIFYDAVEIYNLDPNSFYLEIR